MDSILHKVNVLKHCYNSQKAPPAGNSLPQGMITEDIDAIDPFEGECFNDDVQNMPDTATLSPRSGVEITVAADPEGDSLRPPPEDVRNILDSISEAVFEDTRVQQRFRQDKQLFVLLGRTHDYINQGKSDEACDEISKVQALLA